MIGRGDQEQLRLTVIGPDGCDLGVTRVVIAAVHEPSTLIPAFAEMVEEATGAGLPASLDDYELAVASVATNRTHYLLRCDTRGTRG